MCIVSPCRYRGYQIVVVLVAGRPLWGAERVNFQTRRICAKRLTIILGRKYRSENYHQLENKYKALYTFGPVPILSRRCDTNCGEGEAGGVWWVWNKIASEKKKKLVRAQRKRITEPERRNVSEALVQLLQKLQMGVGAARARSVQRNLRRRWENRSCEGSWNWSRRWEGGWKAGNSQRISFDEKQWKRGEFRTMKSRECNYKWRMRRKSASTKKGKIWKRLRKSKFFRMKHVKRFIEVERKSFQLLAVKHLCCSYCCWWNAKTGIHSVFTIVAWAVILHVYKHSVYLDSVLRKSMRMQYQIHCEKLLYVCRKFNFYNWTVLLKKGILRISPFMTRF